ncbi:MAG: hypothetical protein ACRDH2_06155, partial [Anaerolineales bacterium]
MIRDDVRLALVLGLLALPLLCAHVVYNFVIPQTPARMARSAADLIPRMSLWSAVTLLPLPIPEQGEQIAIALIAFATIAFAAYGAALYVSWKQPKRPASAGAALIAALVFSATSVVALPNVNSDIFIYIAHGRTTAAHHHNPYYTSPDQFPDDPILPYASARYATAVEDKLPAWAWINIPLAWLAGDDPVTSLLVYRAAFLLFNLASLALVAAILQKFNPQYWLTGVILYAWNPIVALHGQSKVDTVMVFFLLLGILLLLTARGVRRAVALVAFALSVFIKLFTVPLLAGYWLWELRAGQWRRVLRDVLVFAITALVIYAPFMEDPGLIVRTNMNLLVRAAPAIPVPFRLLLAGGFALFLLWAGRAYEGRPATLLGSWAIVGLSFSLYLANLGLAHYLITLIAVASLAPNWRV